MQTSGSPKIQGWIFDVYPTNVGEMAVWIISENGQRIRLTDKFQPKIYVSGNKEDLEKLVGPSIQTKTSPIGVLFTNMRTRWMQKNQGF